MGSDITDALRQAVLKRAGHVCEYCLIHERDLYHSCEVDHVVGRKHGGRAEAENLALACFHCNRQKGTDVSSVNPETGDLVRLYNPRTQHWKEHFYLTEGRIEVLSRTGEATCRLLQFNHPERLLFRQILYASGRYLPFH